MNSNRRNFLKLSMASAMGMAVPPLFPEELYENAQRGSQRYKEIVLEPENSPGPKDSIRFSVIGLNHGHIYGMVSHLIEGGGELVAVYAKEPDLLRAFSRRYPDARVATKEEEILEDPTTQLVASAAIPVERAPLGLRVMKAGKDYMVDKPGIVTFEQFEEVKKVQKETGRIYFITYSERLGNRASFKAGELVREGAIGKVVQTVGLGPHRMHPETRPDWYFDPGKSGGILCDIGSHQCDQFLFYTNSKEAEVGMSQIGNFGTPEYPKLQDFGDMSVRSPHATGYIRIDWFTPDGLTTWGDGRTFILGTEGYIEMRKYIDIKGRKGTDHLFLVDRKEITYYDCSRVHTPYGGRLVSDVVNRTETAMPQDHCFLATELALTAQKNAFVLNR